MHSESSPCDDVFRFRANMCFASTVRRRRRRIAPGEKQNTLCHVKMCLVVGQLRCLKTAIQHGRCNDAVIRIEQSALGTVFVCRFGGSKHGVNGCRRTYLSQRDLQVCSYHCVAVETYLLKK